MTLDKSIPIRDLFEAIKAVSSPLLVKLSLLDIYSNEKLGEKHHNVTLRFSYRDSKRTLSQQEVESEHERIVSAAKEKFL